MTKGIPCTTCKDPLERHTIEGCGLCLCPERWTRAKVRELRREAGLPANYNPSNY